MKKIFATFLTFVIVFSLVGCTTQEAANSSTPTILEQTEQTPEEKMANSNFLHVIKTSPYDTSMKLVYDSETHIVYYYQNYKYDRKAASSLCPYYSANGYLCRYNVETNQIEEIIH